MIDQIRFDAGKMKRLHVQPQAVGHGLEKKMMNPQFEMARSMGSKAVLINTIKGNDNLLRMSQKVGFRYFDRYPECPGPLNLSDFFVYMSSDLQ